MDFFSGSSRGGIKPLTFWYKTEILEFFGRGPGLMIAGLLITISIKFSIATHRVYRAAMLARIEEFLKTLLLDFIIYINIIRKHPFNNSLRFVFKIVAEMIPGTGEYVPVQFIDMSIRKAIRSSSIYIYNIMKLNKANTPLSSASEFKNLITVLLKISLEETVLQLTF